VPETDSPLRRSIGLSGVIRFLIAVLAVIAISGAFASGRYAFGIGGVVFFVAAIALGYRGWLARKATAADTTARPPT
jgi:hypothetical protein